MDCVGRHEIESKIMKSAYDFEIDGEALSVKGNYEVTLTSVGNPDFGQDPSRALMGVENSTKRIATLGDASIACQTYIKKNDLGGGHWSGGDVTVDGVLFAKVSYNGRVWGAPS